MRLGWAAVNGRLTTGYWRPTSSQQDAAQAAQLFSIDILDHVIIGDGRFVNLREQGAM